MSSLNWNFFDGRLFQKFCNGLLLFEVSKFAHVFTAEGKDGGVDQYFQEEYEAKKGKWRFQDKFHNSGNKKSDIAALKRDIIEDIRNNYSDEDFIVFITNVNLSKAKYEELIKAAEAEMKSQNILACEFLLWHEANIEALITHYPLLFHWFWSKETVLLQSFEDYFAKPLNASSFDLEYQFSNNFYGRDDNFLQLKAFLKDRDKTTAALIANGGYGKTRLVIELIKNDISHDEDWVPLVISHVGFNPNEFYHLLRSEKKLLLFIDNAHEVPEMVSEVKRLVENNKGKDKLILTTRPTLFSDVLYKLPSHSRNIEKLPLERLGYETTKEMIKSELPHLKSKNIVHLATISKGVPNVILELVRMVRQGRHPNEISVEESFLQSVKEIFKEASKDVESKIGVNRDKFDDFIRLISLISPVPNSKKDIEFIGQFLELRPDKVELLVNQLTETNLLTSVPTLALKPDPYSDTILLETINKNKSFIEHVQKKGVEKYLENILKNLAEAEVDDSHKEAFINKLLSEYIELIERETAEPVMIKKVFEFVKKIVVNKPWAGIYVVKHFLKLYDDSSHPIHKTTGPWETKSYLEQIQDITVEIVFALSNYTLYSRENKEQLHELVRLYIKTTKNLNILDTYYMYHEWDFQYFNCQFGKCCEKQLFLTEKICRYLKTNADSNDITIALHSAHFLLQLEFRLEHYFEPETGAFHYGNAQVPYCNHVKEIRINILNALIDYYKAWDIEEYQGKVLDEFLPYVFYSSNNHSKRYTQDLSEEINIVFTALKEILNNQPSTTVKNRILSQLRLFERVKYQEKYIAIAQELLEEANSTASVFEELELHIINTEYFDVRNNLESRILKTIDKYESFEDFAKDLIAIRLKNEKASYNFESVLSIIGNHFPVQARRLFALIQNSYLELVPEGLFLIKYEYKDEEYFDSILQWLWVRKESFLRPFFWLISVGGNKDEMFYRKSYLKYYSVGIELNDRDIHHFISNNLICYAYNDKTETFRLLDKFIKTIETKEVNTLIYSLLENTARYKKDFKDEMRNLFYSNIQKIDLGSIIVDQIFVFLEEAFGFEDLLNFLEIKLNNEPKKDKLRFYDYERRLYVNPQLSEEETIKRYIKVLNWYINNKTVNTETIKFIIYLFRPSTSVTREIMNAVRAVIPIYKDDLEKLLCLSQAIKAFNSDTEEWIILMSVIAEEVLALDQTIDIGKVFRDSFFYNTGSKSKVGINVPYNEDVLKKDQLEKVLNENTFAPTVSSYLRKCLDKVNRDIKCEIERDKEQSTW